MPYKDPEKAKACKAAYYERNREAVIARAAMAAAANPEREKQRLKDWHAANRERTREDRRAWKRANAAQVAASKTTYRKANPGKWQGYAAARRARKSKATPAWAELQDIEKLYALAEQMRAAGMPVEVDHVVPLRNPLVCGLHVLANLAILPTVTNRSKGNRHWPDMP